MFGGQLRRLWTGALPLEQAFWSYAVLGGIAVNAVTSLGSLILFASDQDIYRAVTLVGLILLSVT